jgi:hypothetical protein
VTVSEDHKFMDLKCYSCFHADLAKEEIAAVHIAVDKPTYHAKVAKEREKMAAEMAAVHMAVDKQTSHPNPTKKVHWGEASK